MIELKIMDVSSGSVMDPCESSSPPAPNSTKSIANSTIAHMDPTPESGPCSPEETVWEYIDFEWVLDSFPAQKILTNFIEFRKQKEAVLIGIQKMSDGSGLGLFKVYFFSKMFYKLGIDVKSVHCSVGNDSQVYYLNFIVGKRASMLFAGPVYEIKALPYTLKFRVFVTETNVAKQIYRYEMVDTSLKDQLWSAAQNRQSTDVEFSVQGRNYPAHRVIIAARSSVFAFMCSNENSETLPLKLTIDNEDPNIFEELLRFIYTGQLNIAANRQLMKIASRYRVETLEALCQAVTSSESNCLVSDKISTDPVEMKPKKFQQETRQLKGKVRSVRNGFLLAYDTSCDSFPLGGSVSWELEFQKEYIFTACLKSNQVTGGLLYRTFSISFTSSHANTTFQLRRVVYSINNGLKQTEMVEQLMGRNDPFSQFFEAKFDKYYCHDKDKLTLHFYVYIGSRAGHFDFQLTDVQRAPELWSVSRSKWMTDIEFVVGGQTFSAHKAVVCSRSPVFEAMFHNDFIESRSGRVVIEDIEPAVFENLLRFIYSGTCDLPFDGSLATLWMAADKYQVEALANLCYCALDFESEVDQVTNQLNSVVLSS